MPGTGNWISGKAWRQIHVPLPKEQNAENKTFHFGAPVPSSHHLATVAEGFIYDGGANVILYRKTGKPKLISSRTSCGVVC